MKAQERHELETNALAKLLVEWGHRLAPYSSHILFGIVAIVAALAIWRLSSSAWSGRGSEGWDQVATTMVELRPDLTPLRGVGQEFDGRTEGEMAKILVADTDLYVAAAQFLLSKEEAMKRLGSAEEIYDELVRGADDPVIRERAKLGKARVLEMKGNITEAIEAYKEVDGLYENVAERRATILAEGNAQEYGEWLRQAQGTIPRRPLGFGGPLDFGADPLSLPQETPPSTGPLLGDALQEFEAIQESSPAAPQTDRYETPPGEGFPDFLAPPADDTPGEASESAPGGAESGGETPPTVDNAPGESPAESSAEVPATEDEPAPQP